MKRFIPVALIGFASCSPPAAPPEPAVEVSSATTTEPVKPTTPKVEAPAPKAETPVVPVQPKKEEAPPPPKSFPFPAGEAGKLLPDVVRPPMPAMPATEKFGAAPKPRAASKLLNDPDALPKLTHSAPLLNSPKPATGSPTAPPERVPFDLGFGSAAVPAKPAFPEAPGINERARDVNLPPDLIPLGRQAADRASLDDPTAEPGNAMIVTKSPFPELGIAAFLRVAIPDPFELGEQVKPKVPATAEPAAAPVVVTPQRMK
ncbi:MAG: hypothetical protein U0791_21280 [Gemmataceae bacterium]